MKKIVFALLCGASMVNAWKYLYSDEDFDYYEGSICAKGSDPYECAYWDGSWANTALYYDEYVTSDDYYDYYKGYYCTKGTSDCMDYEQYLGSDDMYDYYDEFYCVSGSGEECYYYGYMGSDESYDYYEDFYCTAGSNTDCYYYEEQMNLSLLEYIGTDGHYDYYDTCYCIVDSNVCYFYAVEALTMDMMNKEGMGSKTGKTFGEFLTMDGNMELYENKYCLANTPECHDYEKANLAGMKMALAYSGSDGYYDYYDTYYCYAGTNQCMYYAAEALGLDATSLTSYYYDSTTGKYKVYADEWCYIYYDPNTKEYYVYKYF